MYRTRYIARNALRLGSGADAAATQSRPWRTPRPAWGTRKSRTAVLTERCGIPVTRRHGTAPISSVCPAQSTFHGTGRHHETRGALGSIPVHSSIAGSSELSGHWWPLVDRWKAAFVCAPRLRLPSKRIRRSVIGGLDSRPLPSAKSGSWVERTRRTVCLNMCPVVDVAGAHEIAQALAYRMWGCSYSEREGARVERRSCTSRLPSPNCRYVRDAHCR